MDRNGADLTLGCGSASACRLPISLGFLPHLAGSACGPVFIIGVRCVSVAFTFHRRTSLAEYETVVKGFLICGMDSTGLIGSIEENSTQRVPVPATGLIWNCGLPQDIRASVTIQVNFRSPATKYTALFTEDASSVIVILWHPVPIASGCNSSQSVPHGTGPRSWNSQSISGY